MASHPITEYAVVQSPPWKYRIPPKTVKGYGLGRLLFNCRQGTHCFDRHNFCPLVARSLSSQVKLTTYPSYSNVVKTRCPVLPLLVLRCYVKHHCPPSPNTICKFYVVTSLFDILQKLHVFTKICLLTKWSTLYVLSFVLSFNRK
jgi:hypothetical protein